MISDKDPRGMDRFYDFIRHALTKPLISKKIRLVEDFVVLLLLKVNLNCF